MKKYLKMIVAVLGVVGGGWLVFTILHLAADAEQFQSNDAASIAERAQLRDDLEQNEAAVALLTEQLEDLGQEPVVEPPTANESPSSSAPPVDLLRSLVRFAVESSCGGPSCLGPVGPPSTVPGPAGEAGRDGADSTVPGPQGPAGANGADGAPGRGVSNVSCEADGTWLIAYTDGTTSTTPGPCRFIPEQPVDPPLEPAA